MEELEFNYTSKEEVTEFLGQNKNRQKDIQKFADEYNDVEKGRNLRELQIGKRKNYTQGSTTVVAERLPIQYQKKIVNTAVSFLFGDAPEIRASDVDSEDGKSILKVIKDNRIHAKLQDFAESVMSTTIGVFIFSKNEEGDIKTRMYNHENGKFTPQYDVYGDLTAFFWEFKIGETDHLWIFTADTIYQYSGDGEYSFIEQEPHEFGVIPVVFVEQKNPEWWDVKEMIDRLEMLTSKLAGSNNYFAFPILKMLGAVTKDKDGNDQSSVEVSDDGKSILTGYAEFNGQVVKSDAEFLQRDTGVDSIKLEKEILQEFIHSISQTPDLSFDNVKGIGAISGHALVLMLQDAINKAKRKKGTYETAIERIISVIKNGLNITNDELTFEIEFKYSIPVDEKEVIEMLVTAAGNKAIISQETAVQNNPLVKHPGEEMDLLKAETQQDRVRNLGDTYTL